MIRIFFMGLLISFLGTLPLGVLNISTARLAVSEGIAPAISFSLGALLVEMGYVRLSLVAMDWVRTRERWFRWLQWLSLAIVLVMAIAGFKMAAGHAALHSASYAGGYPGDNGDGMVFFASGLHWKLAGYFIAGVLLSAVNPLQIPFWFGWSTVLIRKGALLPRSDHYNGYIAGIGLGTMAGNGIFIVGGNLLIKGLSANRAVFNALIGGMLLLTGLIQVVKMLAAKNAGKSEKVD